MLWGTHTPRILSPESPCFLLISTSNPSIFFSLFREHKEIIYGNKTECFRKMAFFLLGLSSVDGFLCSTLDGAICLYKWLWPQHIINFLTIVWEVGNQISDANRPPIAHAKLILWVNTSSLKSGTTLSISLHCPSTVTGTQKTCITYFIVTKELRDHSPNQIHFSTQSNFPFQSHSRSVVLWMSQASRLRSELSARWIDLPKHMHISYLTLTCSSFSASSLHFLAVILLTPSPFPAIPNLQWVIQICRTTVKTDIPPVAVHQGCHNKVTQTGWLKRQKFIFSYFWSLEVWGHSVVRVISSKTSLLGL